MVEIQNITQCYKLTFPTSREVGQASKALMDATVADPIGTERLITTPDRIVMWQETVVVPDERTLYLSAGALSRLRQLQPNLPELQLMKTADLPGGLAGDDR